MKKYLLLILLTPLAVFGQNTVTPSSAFEGDNLQVFISGTQQDFYNDWSSCMTQTRFIHSDNQNISNGIINMSYGYYNWSAGGIYENINTYNRPVGSYHLQNKGCYTGGSWQTLAYNALAILAPPSILTVSPDEVTVD